MKSFFRALARPDWYIPLLVTGVIFAICWALRQGGGA